MYRQWVPCEYNSSYNFILIFLKLCTCFLHGLKMCMWFGYNPCVYFCYLFPLCELCHLLTSDSMKMLWQWVPCERNSSYNFILIFLKLCTCFRHGLEICIRFGYNPWINFCHFFHFVNFVIFWPQILWKSRDSGYLVSATPHTVLYRSLWNFAHIFAMVWRYEHGLDIILELIFVTFSTLWTLSFLTSDSMKVYRQWLPCKRNSLYNFMPVFMQLCTSYFPWFEDVHVVWI